MFSKRSCPRSRDCAPCRAPRRRRTARSLWSSTSTGPSTSPHRTCVIRCRAGRIESTRREFSVRSLGELKTAREFGELAVASQGTQLVKLKDVARVELGPEDDRSIFRYNGSPAVAIGVVRQSKANLIDVARNIREALPSIQQTLPPGVKLQTAWDGSVFVTHSINDARLTLLIAAILVVLIIFVFLRNVRATRSEEHTSELQSRLHLVCRLLLEKKKTT